MFDFGALTPEINSGRMYVGPGSGPLLAAAAAWDELAAELQSTASRYASAIASLTSGPWTGPSSIAMAASAAPYVAWMNATGAQAEEAGAQAKIAACAYEAAFAATVPPPVIAANRALLAALIATNLLGQNTPAIAATEAHYMEMWAQDAAAMYAYAGSSAAAAQLTPFTEPPQTTNGSGPALQTAALAQSGAGSGLLNSPATGGTNLLPGLSLPQLLAAPPVPPELANFNTIFATLTGPYSIQGLTSIVGGPFLSFGQIYALAQNGQGAAAYLAGPKAISGALAPLTSGVPAANLSSLGSPVSASMGRAALVSGLSVPQGWAQAAPALKTLATVLPSVEAAEAAAPMIGPGGAFNQMALSSLAGRAIAANATYSGASGAARTLGGLVEANPAAATIIVIPALEE